MTEDAVPDWLSADELEGEARRRLPADVFDHVAGGAGDELTQVANLDAYLRFRLRPRVLVDVSSVSTSTVILGMEIGCPIFVSPMGSQGLLHPRGEAAIAVGAARAGAGLILSMTASSTMAEVADAAGPARWFQLYFLGRDRHLIEAVVNEAAATGYKAICVTVDSASFGFRRRDMRHVASGSTLLESIRSISRYGIQPGSVVDPSLNWKDIEWLSARTRLPIVLKGITAADDARKAHEHGVRGVIVSNHGGRQLDHGIATLDALPDVVAAVEGKLAVLIDGGVRRPTDVVIALALGADAVAIGRPVAWALAVGGADGVASYLTSMADGLARTMALLGVTTTAEVGAAHIARVG
jgi:4-hydroxymandelate oxidase